ncbi:hypothetical protein E3N88_00645 [Mikania micrantha]|uniref:MHD domain-containing protein n=1 Tax=Mikania micrantha TaxID=192012 RepID=A0A5N6PYR1_9ASTR|nr:hypothetical protein E3N88_00645 [Mikania micrantha]
MVYNTFLRCFRSNVDMMSSIASSQLSVSSSYKIENICKGIESIDYNSIDKMSRVKKLRNTPIYVKPQVSSESANLTANHGTVNILADKTCSWSIGRFPKDKTPQMSGTLVLEEGLEQFHVKPTFQVGFKIMGVALSGLKINKLDVKNLPAPAHKGFRAQTEAGRYEVRS